MNCREAQQLIDRRIHEEWAASTPRAPGVPEREPPHPDELGPEPDWSALDAHLARCPKCQADYAELSRTRKLLADVTADEPADEEIDSMWTAIHAAQATSAVITRRPARRRGYWPFLAATVGTAALLLLAFLLGTWHYPASQLAGALSLSRVPVASPVSQDRVDEARRGHWMLVPGEETGRRYFHAGSFGEAGARREVTEQRGGQVALGDKAVRRGLPDSDKPESASFGYGALDSRRGAGVVGHEETRRPPQEREQLASLGYIGGASYGEASAVSEQRDKDVRGVEVSGDGLSDFDADGPVLGSRFTPTPPPQIPNVPETAQVVERYPAEAAYQRELSIRTWRAELCVLGFGVRRYERGPAGRRTRQRRG
jgi:hypothetical protein